ncbi:hypothetical protein PInf_009669 [Phytophthora infestans]|nr:hypothetical protein PInf_009669 [Phytophthora infestans]
MTKLEVEDSAGTAGENVMSWLEAVKQAQQMQMVLYGEEWTSGDVYYDIPAHRKRAAATRFRKWDAQTPPEMKNAANLEWHLRDTYGSRESAWEPHGTGGGYHGLTSSFYVDAFTRGLDNKISAQVVRTAKPLTLEQAVSFSIKNCGKYGEGVKVNNWELAAQMHEKKRGHEAYHASAATTAEPADQLDWTKPGLSIGASGDKPPRYDPEVDPSHGDGETAARPLPAAEPRDEPPHVYGDHPTGHEQHPTSRSEVKRRRSADEAETPGSGDGGQGHFRLAKTPRTVRATSEASATNDKEGSEAKESIAARTRSQLRRAPHPATKSLVIKNEGQVTLAELQSKVPPAATAAKVKECRRRRYRARSGRYVLEFEIDDRVIDLTTEDQSDRRENYTAGTCDGNT